MKLKAYGKKFEENKLDFFIKAEKAVKALYEEKGEKSFTVFFSKKPHYEVYDNVSYLDVSSVLTEFNFEEIEENIVKKLSACDKEIDSSTIDKKLRPIKMVVLGLEDVARRSYEIGNNFGLLAVVVDYISFFANQQSINMAKERRGKGVSKKNYVTRNICNFCCEDVGVPITKGYDATIYDAIKAYGIIHEKANAFSCGYCEITVHEMQYELVNILLQASLSNCHSLRFKII